MASDYRIPSSRVSCWALLLFCLHYAHAFYIPGWSIKSYAEAEPIPLFVNKAYSDNTQIQYAYSELPFVCPASGRKRAGFTSGSNVALNLGEVLRGDRIIMSDYELEMGQDEEQHYLCSRKVDKAGLKRAVEIVQQGYVAEWIVDNLPGATSFVTVDKSRKYYASGFKLGYEEVSLTTGLPQYFLNNHVTLVIRWRAAPGGDGQRGKKVIVGFEVYAKSIETENRNTMGFPADLHDVANGLELTFNQNSTNFTASAETGTALQWNSIDDAPDDATITIPYTYSVYFREEEHLEWSNRWDLYFVNQEESNHVHWLAIINSIFIAAVLSFSVAYILTRTIRGDINKGHKELNLEDGKIRSGRRGRGRGNKSPRKNSVELGSGLLEKLDGSNPTGDVDSDDEEIPEEMTGWKLVHGDVFRQPSHGLLLAPLIGSGMQLVFMAVGLVTLSCFGILNPSFRGGFISVGFALFVFAGSFSGYFSARVYKTFGGSNWKQNAVVTATLFPGLIFATIFVLNLFVWAQASSTAIPLGTVLGLVALWLLVQVPLVYAGSWYGYDKAGPYTHPIRATAVPRQIPQQAWFLKSFHSILLAGLVPFGVIFIELLFVFRSLWQDKSSYYFMYGYLAMVSAILVLAVMETTIIAVYLQLCSENYHWWWQSFFVGGSSSIWIFFYCVYYYANHLHITGLASAMLFFSYSFLSCLVYGLLTGTIGFLTAYAFVRRIYGAIKVD